MREDVSCYCACLFFPIACRRALGASFFIPRGIHSSADEEKNTNSSGAQLENFQQDSIGGGQGSDLSSSLGDVTTLVESSIRDVELSLIANSGYWWPVESTFSFLHYLHSSLDLSW